MDLWLYIACPRLTVDEKRASSTRLYSGAKMVLGGEQKVDDLSKAAATDITS
jgi:diphthamide synthase subunit DPH2